jgi:hypothetical protein
LIAPFLVDPPQSMLGHSLESNSLDLHPLLPHLANVLKKLIVQRLGDVLRISGTCIIILLNVYHCSRLIFFLPQRSPQKVC